MFSLPRGASSILIVGTKIPQASQCGWGKKTNKQNLFTAEDTVEAIKTSQTEREIFATVSDERLVPRMYIHWITNSQNTVIRK